MKMPMVNKVRPSYLARVCKALRGAALLLVFAPLALAIVPGEAQARDPAFALLQRHLRLPESSLEGVAAWLNDRFSAEELEALSPETFGIESQACNCSDKPAAHFPYLVVLFTTAKGDLLARPEGQENMARFTPLAVRNGDEYCGVSLADPCYGSFANVCEFTDFRYGATLQPYFPTCK